MSDYTGTAWDEDEPTAARSISAGDDRIREVKAMVGEMFDRQHKMDRTGDDSSDATIDNGEHRPGVCGVMAEDTSANLIAAANYNESLGGSADKVTGAVAWDTTLKCQVKFNGTAWIPITPYVVTYDYDATGKTMSTGHGTVTKYDVAAFGSNGDFSITTIIGQLVVIEASLRTTTDMGSGSNLRGYIYENTAGAINGFELVHRQGTVNMSREFVATGTTHAFSLRASHTYGSNLSVSVAWIRITIYPGDYS